MLNIFPNKLFTLQMALLLTEPEILINPLGIKAESTVHVLHTRQ